MPLDQVAYGPQMPEVRGGTGRKQAGLGLIGTGQYGNGSSCYQVEAGSGRMV